MKTRKQKIPFNLVADLGYYKFSRFTVDGVKGYLYFMCDKLTNDVKEKVLKYNNTKLFISVCQFAPEIKHNCIFVGDKCF